MCWERAELLPPLGLDLWGEGRCAHGTVVFLICAMLESWQKFLLLLQSSSVTLAKSCFVHHASACYFLLPRLCLLRGFSSRALLSQKFFFTIHFKTVVCDLSGTCFADGWFREDNLADKHRVFHLLTKRLLGICALCLVWKVPVVILVACPACLTCCSSHRSIPAMGISCS